MNETFVFIILFLIIVRSYPYMRSAHTKVQLRVLDKIFTPRGTRRLAPIGIGTWRVPRSEYRDDEFYLKLDDGTLISVSEDTFQKVCVGDVITVTCTHTIFGQVLSVQ